MPCLDSAERIVFTYVKNTDPKTRNLGATERGIGFFGAPNEMTPQRLPAPGVVADY